MTQEELRESVKETFVTGDNGYWNDETLNKQVDEIVKYINQHVAEVIGDADKLHQQDIEDKYGSEAEEVVKAVLAEQRKRAGLDEKPTFV
jgi:hypothetical protein